MKRLVIAAAAVLFASSAAAQQRRPAPPAPAPAPATAAAPSATPQADAMFDSMDVNRDGTVSRDEFRTGWVAMNRTIAVREGLRRQFASVDANSDGSIDATEYRNLRLIRQAGNTAPPLAQFDADRDGKLGFPEYVELVRQLAPIHGAAADAAGRPR